MWFLVKNNIIQYRVNYDGVSPYTVPEGFDLVQYTTMQVNPQIGWVWNNGNPVELTQS